MTYSGPSFWLENCSWKFRFWFENSPEVPGRGVLHKMDWRSSSAHEIYLYCLSLTLVPFDIMPLKGKSRFHELKWTIPMLTPSPPCRKRNGPSGQARGGRWRLQRGEHPPEVLSGRGSHSGRLRNLQHVRCLHGPHGWRREGSNTP